MVGPGKFFEVQVYDIVKGVDPTARIHTRGNGGRKVVNGETVGVVGGGVRRIWKGFYPRFDGPAFQGVEFDMSEKVASCTRDP